MKNIEEFEKRVCEFGKIRPEGTIQVIDRGRRSLTVKIYTSKNSYHISANCDGADGGYLGCTASSRTPLAGEEQTRGSDLADGNFSEETWTHILEDIVAYELAPLAKGVKSLD